MNKESCPDIRREIADVLNKYSRENKSNTADFLLAEFMLECLEAYERIINKRNTAKLPCTHEGEHDIKNGVSICLSCGEPSQPPSPLQKGDS